MYILSLWNLEIECAIFLIKRDFFHGGKIFLMQDSLKKEKYLFCCFAKKAVCLSSNRYLLSVNEVEYIRS